MIRGFIRGEEVNDDGFEGGQEGAIFHGEADGDKLIFKGFVLELAVDAKLL